MGVVILKIDCIYLLLQKFCILILLASHEAEPYFSAVLLDSTLFCTGGGEASFLSVHESSLITRGTAHTLRIRLTKEMDRANSPNILNASNNLFKTLLLHKKLREKKPSFFP